MSIAYWCILVAALLPYLTVGIAKATSRYDNADPRAPGMYEGLASRAHGAHQNGFEAFPFFAVAVVVASAGVANAGVASPRIPLLDGLAVGWILVRIAYVAAYLANRPTLRSSVWCLGFLIATAIFTMPVWHG